jgi:hypothetical protein
MVIEEPIVGWVVRGAPSRKPNPGLSKFNYQAIAPAFVNSQTQTYLSVCSHQCHGRVLEELNQLFTGVYNGRKLQGYVQIFAVILVLMIVWERIQFDSLEFKEVGIGHLRIFNF